MWEVPPGPALPGQHEQIGVGDKVGEGVEGQHRVDVVLGHIVLHTVQVVPGIKQVDLREPLSEEGGQGVGVGVPDDQHLGAVGGLVAFDDAQGLTAAQEVGVLFLHVTVASLLYT